MHLPDAQAISVAPVIAISIFRRNVVSVVTLAFFLLCDRDKITSLRVTSFAVALAVTLTNDRSVSRALDANSTYCITVDTFYSAYAWARVGASLPPFKPNAYNRTPGIP